jgi:putative component of toxin-antitoxin plasmid stabilization module
MDRLSVVLLGDWKSVGDGVCERRTIEKAKLKSQSI